jgi:hypothetical protein
MERSQVKTAYCECRKENKNQIIEAKAECTTDDNRQHVEEFMRKVKKMVKCDATDEQ